MEIAFPVEKATRPVGRPRVHVSSQLILNLRNQGLSFRQIATDTGFGYGTVRRAFHRIEPAQAAGQQR
jgi:transposase